YVVVRYLMQPPTQPDVSQGRAVAESFLHNVSDGKAGDAWESSTAELKSIEGRESFMKKTSSAPILHEPLEFASTQEVKVQDSPRTEFLYTSMKSGKMVRVLVGYDQGQWKVDRLTY
ncbi:MAG: hypothetical protein JNL18_10225, partial [Planctomycetaceae bacterium]|nr:hypothetical protein [Planctomycetaceae bacterium]